MSDDVNVSLEPAEETDLTEEAARTPTVAENWPVHPPELGEIFKSDVKTTDPSSPANDNTDTTKADESENDASKKNDSASPDKTTNSA